MISSRLSILLSVLFAVGFAQGSGPFQPEVADEKVFDVSALEARIDTFKKAVTSGNEPEDYNAIFATIKDYHEELGKDLNDHVDLFFKLSDALLDSAFTDPARFEPILECFHLFFPVNWQRDGNQAEEALKIIEKAIAADIRSGEPLYEAQFKGLKTRFASGSPAHSSPSKQGSLRSYSAGSSTPLLPSGTSSKLRLKATFISTSVSTDAGSTSDGGNPEKNFFQERIEAGADSGKIDPNTRGGEPAKPTDTSLGSTGTDGEPEPKTPPSQGSKAKNDANMTPEPSQEPVEISAGKKAFVVIAALGIAALLGLELFSLAKSKTVV